MIPCTRLAAASWKYTDYAWKFLLEIFTICMTLKQGSKVKFDTCKRFADHDFQEVVFSFTPRTNDKGDVRAFWYATPPPFDIKDVTWQPFCFQNKAKITQTSFPNTWISSHLTASHSITSSKNNEVTNVVMWAIGSRMDYCYAMAWLRLLYNFKFAS